MHSMCRVIWLIKLITLIHFTSSVSTVETRISFVTVETKTMTAVSIPGGMSNSIWKITLIFHILQVG